MILFRADANSSIGMGHVMRCLSLADALSLLLRDGKNEIKFIVADEPVVGLIQSRGYDVIVLHTVYTHMDDEVWPDIHPSTIIIDSYFVTADYLTKLKNRFGCCIVYIDDVLSFPYPVDVLINYNAYASLSAYEELYKDVDMPSLILGPAYAPLRGVFQGIGRREQKEKVENVLISTGGSDELHLARLITETLCDDGKTYHLLLGAMNMDKEAIREMAEGKKNIVLHENVSDMKSLISSMDICISAAGSTLYEICACGVPLITYSLADNQLPGADAFERLGLAVNVGDLREASSIDHNAVISGELKSDAVEILLTAVTSLSNNYPLRTQMGNAMQSLIDGRGADRMAERVLFLSTLQFLGLDEDEFEEYYNELDEEDQTLCSSLISSLPTQPQNKNKIYDILGRVPDEELNNVLNNWIPVSSLSSASQPFRCVDDEVDDVLDMDDAGEIDTGVEEK